MNTGFCSDSFCKVKARTGAVLRLFGIHKQGRHFRCLRGAFLYPLRYQSSSTFLGDFRVHPDIGFSFSLFITDVYCLTTMTFYQILNFACHVFLRRRDRIATSSKPKLNQSLIHCHREIRSACEMPRSSSESCPAHSRIGVVAMTPVQYELEMTG